MSDPSVPDTVIERAAQAIYEDDQGGAQYGIPWANQVESEREVYRTSARAALAASGVLEENRRLRAACRFVIETSAGSCENYTSGIGACFTAGRSETAPYGADRVCNACFCWRAALALEET